MAADENPKDIDAADKAYQAAAESVPVKPAAPAKADPVASAQPDPTKADVMQRKIASAPKAPETLVRAEAAKPAKSVAKNKAKAEAKKTKKPAPVAKPGPLAKAAAKPVPAQQPAKFAREKIKKPAVSASAVRITAPKPKSITTEPAFAGLLSNFMLKETTMDMNLDFSKFQDTMTEAQAKAKAAFEKGNLMLGEASDFAKGNVEAVMESGKILANGMQSFGSEIVSESRSAFETMSGDIKELAAAKSPTDFFKIQGDMMRKNFDSAVAYSSKNSETMLKLMSDAMAPISGRVSMAVNKVRSTSV
jgi:Uncharacterized conserved protein